jgi:hypothetical protein
VPSEIIMIKFEKRIKAVAVEHLSKNGLKECYLNCFMHTVATMMHF